MIAFDKETCVDFDTASSKEWLETNGLGGFASSTIINCNTRRYHGLLVAATRPPVGRMMLLNGLEEFVLIKNAQEPLSCHQYPNALYPAGFEHLIGFRLDPWPVWTYQIGSIIVEKSAAMIHGKNTTVITYSARNPIAGATLVVRPLLTARDIHSVHLENDLLQSAVEQRPGVCILRPYPGVGDICLHHNAGRVVPGLVWFRQMEYARERERGLDFYEDCWSPGEFHFALTGEEPAVLIATTEGAGYHDAKALLDQERARRRSLLNGWEKTDDVTHQLVSAADQFIVERLSAPAGGASGGKTVIAGYHWFGDWGRDTFIALPGLLLATGRFGDAKEILSGFAGVIDQGMTPNHFPESGEIPDYNSVDSSLWYIVAIFHFLRYTRDFDFVRDQLWDKMKEIVTCYQNGTRYQIHMDIDGLIFAGATGMQLTWMDAKVGDWVVTPRAGKPVEIQALWYNTLRIMDQLGAYFGDADAARRWGSLAEKVWASFNRIFWYDDGGYLYDVVNGDQKDFSLRPNQIFAAGLPFDLLPPDRASSVVAVVGERLLTPVGLRTLDPRDPRYVGRYQGDPRTRDASYHQGTAWPWLMGPFLSAYQKVNGRTPNIQTQIRAHLALLLTHLWEAGLGTISEIFDGDAPHEPRGAIAQAWSVAEVLRVLREEIGTAATGPASGAPDKGATFFPRAAR